jgi:hypothetical protein
LGGQVVGLVFIEGTQGTIEPVGFGDRLGGVGHAADDPEHGRRVVNEGKLVFRRAGGFEQRHAPDRRVPITRLGLPLRTRAAGEGE